MGHQGISRIDQEKDMKRICSVFLTLMVLTAGLASIAFADEPAQTQDNSALSKVISDLNDPAVPLESLVKVTGISAGMHAGLQEFNGVAVKCQPTLHSVATSKVLKLMGRVPVAGSLISTAQFAASLLDETIKASAYMEKVDSETVIPIHKGLSAAYAVTKDPSEENIKASRDAWQQALPAVDRRLAQITATSEKATSLTRNLRSVEDRLGEYNAKLPGKKISLNIKPVSAATNKLNTFLDSKSAEMLVYKAYFTRLLEDSSAL
jgi:hypothetical protein